MRCLMTNFAEFLPELFQTVMEAYRKYPICSYIYVLEVSITIFHGVQSY